MAGVCGLKVKDATAISHHTRCIPKVSPGFKTTTRAQEPRRGVRVASPNQLRGRARMCLMTVHSPSILPSVLCPAAGDNMTTHPGTWLSQSPASRGPGTKPPMPLLQTAAQGLHLGRGQRQPGSPSQGDTSNVHCVGFGPQSQCGAHANRPLPVLPAQTPSPRE